MNFRNQKGIDKDQRNSIMLGLAGGILVYWSKYIIDFTSGLFELGSEALIIYQVFGIVIIAMFLFFCLVGLSHILFKGEKDETSIA